MVFSKNKLKKLQQNLAAWKKGKKIPPIPNSGSASKDQIGYDLIIFVSPLVVLQSTKYFASVSSQAIPDFERSWVDK